MPSEYKERLDEILEGLKAINDRLFKDNGGECLQSKINRHEQSINTQEKRWKYVITTLTALCIGVFGRLIILAITALAK